MSLPVTPSLAGLEDRQPAHPVSWNQRVVRRLERTVLGDFSMETIYRDAVQSSTTDQSLILDAGAGQRCVYSDGRQRVVGADALLRELRSNNQIKFGVVADLEQDFPFRSNSLDAVTACYFIEHVSDSEKFIKNVAMVLRPEGMLFLLFPCRYAPFAIINRMLPNKLTSKLLRRFVEGSHGGFPANYDNCWPSRMQRILAQNGLEVVAVELCFYQSHYYASFLPFYLCSFAYDMLMKLFKMQWTAASACIVAKKILPAER